MLNLDSLLDNLSGYVETRLALFKLEVQEDVSRLLAKGLVAAFNALCFFFFLVFLSIGSAVWIGNSVGRVGGFMIVAGIYLLMAVILIAYRKPILEKLEKVMLETVKHNRKKKEAPETPEEL